MANEIQTVLSYAWIHLIESSLFAIGMIAVYYALPFAQAKHRFLILQAAMLKFLVPTVLIAGLLPGSDRIGTPLDTLFATAVSGSSSVVSSGAILQSGSFWVAIAWLVGFIALMALPASVWIRELYSKSSDSNKTKECPPRYTNLFEQADYPLEWVDRTDFPSIGVCGIFRPRIVINRAFLEALSEEEVRLAFVHETAHIKRRDNLWRGIHSLIVFVFWFHPLVWFLRSRLRLESEHACDEAVLLSEERPRRYAECLVKAASLVSSSNGLWATSFTDTSLKKRVSKILAFKNMRESKLKLTALIAVSIVFAGALASASSTALAKSVDLRNESNTGKTYDLKEVDTYPRAIYQIDSVYPEDAPDVGWASLEWVIDSEGRVIRPQVKESSDRIFEKPSIDAILQSQWKPAIKDGEAVNVRVRQKMEFKRGK